MKRGYMVAAFYMVLIIVVFSMFMVIANQKQPKAVTYQELIKEFYSDNVKEFYLEDFVITCTLKNDNKIVHTLLTFNLFEENVLNKVTSPEEQAKEGAVKFDVRPGTRFPWWTQFIPFIILIVILVVFWFFASNQNKSGGVGQGRSAMSFGRARTKLGTDEKNKKTFDDVAGAEEEKEELKEVVEFLKFPAKFANIGARIPKGVLLVGPPGTGKTLIAKAVAGEAGVPFFSISGSEFVELYVGVGASRVRDLFEQAKKSAPCILFIDEIDAVGRQRGAGLGGGNDEREQTLNQLLVEMDGFGNYEGVVVIAATNRPDILDPALLRPGRFDRQVVMDIPDIQGREAVLAVHAKSKPLDTDVDLSIIAKGTVGFTPADLENVLNEAALLTVRQGRTKINLRTIEDAIMKVVAGPEKKTRVMSEDEKRLVCFHEAGHAVTMRHLKTSDPVHQISIVPRGRTGGYTLSLPKEDKSYHSKTSMFESIVGLLGGRAAEKLVLNEISTGASNDIQRATGIARAMVTKYGMSALGPIQFGPDHDEVFLGRDFASSRNFSESVAAQIDDEMMKIIDGAMIKASEILAENIEKLKETANFLANNEKMSGQQFDALFAGTLKEDGTIYPPPSSESSGSIFH